MGLFTKNPFDFKHYKINFVALNVDGRQIPANPLQPDLENAGYIRSYMGLYTSMGKMYQDKGIRYRKRLIWIRSDSGYVGSGGVSTDKTG